MPHTFAERKATIVSAPILSGDAVLPAVVPGGKLAASVANGDYGVGQGGDRLKTYPTGA